MERKFNRKEPSIQYWISRTINDIVDLYMNNFFLKQHAERVIVNDLWMLFVKRLMNSINVNSSVGETSSTTSSIAANSNSRNNNNSSRSSNSNKGERLA
jgi:DNA-directed RNA polymerase